MGSAKIPIYRIGVADALRLIREKGYRLVNRELISPPKPIRQVTRYQTSDPGGCAEYYVTKDAEKKIKEELVKP